MTTTIKKKNPTFRAPLTDKIPHPLAQAIAKRQNKFTFNEYDNAFILRRSSIFCYHDSVIADFMPQVTDDVCELITKKKRKNPKYNKLYSTYNKDHKHYTPAFVIGKDLRDYAQTPVYDLQKFKQKLLQAQNRASDNQGKTKQQILVPKPSSHKCQVCRTQYQDYLQHIKQEKHLQFYRCSIGWKYISQFVNQFTKNQQIQGEKNNANSKTIRKTQIQNKQNKIQNKNTDNKKRMVEIQKLVNQVTLNKNQFKTKHIYKKSNSHKDKRNKINKNIGVSSTHVTLS